MYSEIIANLQVCALKEMLPQSLLCESTQQPFIKQTAAFPAHLPLYDTLAT